jgi:cephalosporin-C deacetylase
MKKLSILSVIVLGLLITLGNEQLFAQKAAPANDDNSAGEVSTVLTAHSKNAIFSDKASYTFDVKNTFDKSQSGTIKYIVTDQFNKELLADSVDVKLGRQSSHSYDFTVQPLKSGFYKINFMINVNDYDDTTRRVFGIRPEEIRSAHERPADFDEFWDKSKKELAAVNPDYKITEKPELEKDKRKVFLIEMKSLGNVTIYAWLTEPEHHTKYQKFPVLLMLPGYQATNIPLMGRDDDMAFVGLDVRGQGLSKQGLEMRREDYIVSRLENKDHYIMRGIVMDCIRALDFIYSRPELGHDRIAVTGGSMGGYLSLTTAALDKRVAICAPQNPFLSDIYNMDNGAVQWPIQHMKEYVKIRPGLTFDKVLDNLQYFDTKNFASTITCPVLMGIGLLDPFVPPNNSYTVYNNIKSKKKLFVFKDLGHEVGGKYYTYETLWTRDAFALF